MKTKSYATESGRFQLTEIADDPDNRIVAVRFPNETEFQFTANDETKDWGHCGGDNWARTEEVAADAGLDADQLFPTVEPLLNTFVGW